jgi:leishmanolysin
VWHEQVREHFGCDSLFGAKLEDEGFRGTVGSHWDSRWFQGEIMDGATDGSSSQNVFSSITMAVLEDTGWCVPELETRLFRRRVAPGAC